MKKMAMIMTALIGLTNGAYAGNALDSLSSAAPVMGAAQAARAPEIKLPPVQEPDFKASSLKNTDYKIENFRGYHVGNFPKGFFARRTDCFVRIKNESTGAIRLTIRDEDHETGFDKTFSLSSLKQSVSVVGSHSNLTATSGDGYKISLLLDETCLSPEIIEEVMISKNGRDLAYCGMMAGGDPKLILQYSRGIYPEDGIR